MQGIASADTIAAAGRAIQNLARRRPLFFALAFGTAAGMFWLVSMRRASRRSAADNDVDSPWGGPIDAYQASPAYGFTSGYASSEFGVVGYTPVHAAGGLATG